MKYSTIAVIYNPNSTGPGESFARDFVSQVQERLPQQAVELIATERAGHGEEISYLLATTHESPLIISSSGDGGYHDIINGIMRANRDGAHATAGLLPAGNANDHYANLHDEDIVEQIANGGEKKVDLLRLTGMVEGKLVHRYAHSYIGFGLTPEVAGELNKTKLNPFNEMLIVIRSLLSVKPVRLNLGKKPRKYTSVIFSNVDVMSKYLKISRPSSMTDGKFEVTAFRQRNIFQLLTLLVKASVAGVEEDVQTGTFSLKTVRKTLVQLDGELLALDGDSEVVITAEQQTLACVV